jgi:hypothetical protein
MKKLLTFLFVLTLIVCNCSKAPPPAPPPNPYSGLLARLAELESAIEIGTTQEKLNDQLIAVRAELKLHPLTNPDDLTAIDVIEVDCNIVGVLWMRRDMAITRRGEDPMSVTTGPRADDYAEWRESDNKVRANLKQKFSQLRIRLSTNAPVIPKNGNGT